MCRTRGTKRKYSSVSVKEKTQLADVATSQKVRQKRDPDPSKSPCRSLQVGCGEDATHSEWPVTRSLRGSLCEKNSSCKT